MQKEVIMGHTQNGKQFFLTKITKADHQLKLLILSKHIML